MMLNMSIKSYKELIVWQKGMELVGVIYFLTGRYPREELYCLTNQTRRAAISVVANIAEGQRRSTKKDYRHFLVISYGSGAELETLIEVAKRLKYSQPNEFFKADQLLLEVMKMLNTMLRKLDA